MMEASCSRFTAAEGGARLAAAAATKNILAVEYASFIPVRLLYEKAYQIRGSLSSGKKRSIYITRATRVPVVAFELNILTDLATVAAQEYDVVEEWREELETKEVVICTSSVLRGILEAGILTISNINIMIIDSCHLIYKDEDLQYIMKQYKSTPQQHQPLILALTYPLFTKKQSKDSEEMGVYENLDDFHMYEQLEWKVEELEQELCCHMDLAEDIDGGKRMSASSSKPRELIIEFGSKPSDEDLPPLYRALEHFMRESIHDAMAFVEDHRHDPTEIYGEELYEEFMNIPDPTIDPKQIFKQFLYVLDQLGPYAADKAAFSLLMKLEKLKIKIPYERHFLLLCLCTTVFIKIRCYADYLFNQVEDEWEKIRTFSSTKVLRFAEILEKFQPPDLKNYNSLTRKDSSLNSETKSEETSIKTKKMLNDIDECDFTSLGDKLEDKVNTLVCNLKEIYDYPTENILKPDTVSEGDTPKTKVKTTEISKSNISDTQHPENTLKEEGIIKETDSLMTIETSTGSTKSDSNTKINESTDTIQDKNIEINYTTENTNKMGNAPHTSGAKINESTDTIQDESIETNYTAVNTNKTGNSPIKNEIQDENLKTNNTILNTTKTCYTSTNITLDSVNEFKNKITDIPPSITTDSGTEYPTKMEHNPQNTAIPDTGISGPNTPSNTATLDTGISGLDTPITRLDTEGNELVLQKATPDTGISGPDTPITGLDTKSNELVLQKATPNTGISGPDTPITGLDSKFNELVLQKATPDSGISGLNTPITGLDIKGIELVTQKGLGGPDTPITGPDTKGNELVLQKGLLGFTRRTGHRLRGRTRLQRNNAARQLQMQQNPDALCGIVYMKEALIAKIMFMIIVDMSRANPKLSYLCAQYCATESPADPGTEPRECQRQGKKQEEVLKKFRMHECNLLLATSALEEGIDLPRCNLVLRWDVPPSYRSYGLCRGRARAARSSAALLCSDNKASTEMLLQHVAIYKELDQIISRKCGCGIQDEPPQSEEDYADSFTIFIQPYTPNDATTLAKDKDNTEKINDTTDTKDKSKSNIAERIEEAFREKDRSFDAKKEKDISYENGAVNVEKNVIEKDCLVINLKPKDVIKDKKDTTDLKGKETEAIKVIENGYLEDANYDSDGNDRINTLVNKTENLIINNEILQNSETGEIEVQNVIIEQSEQKVDQFNNIGEQNAQETVITNKDLKKELIPTVNDHSNLKIEQETNAINEESNSKIEHPASNSKSEPVLPNEINRDEILAKVYCNKCYNVKINNVCLCGNISLYYTMLAKSNSASKIVKSESKKSVSEEVSVASVDMSTAIALINRYCGKLPSDTFTRLAPQWWMEEVQLPIPGSEETRPAYICTLRLPLNCPVKYNIVGHPMPTKVLARRMVALQACRILHKSGELDNQLMPIGKENFKAIELDSTNSVGTYNTDATDANDAARPGTTKRRQYYYKRTAWAFTDCQPVVDTTDAEIDSPSPQGTKPDAEPVQEPEQSKAVPGKKRNMLYAIVSKLWCALPERYNTRGRRLHAPQNASQAIGILMARHEPDSLQIPAFPVYTRSGEVRVSVEHVPNADVRLSPRRGRLVRRFMKFVFAEVLRVRRRGMKLQSEGSTHNNYYIVPTVKTTQPDGTPKIDIDWAFLELIYDHTENKKLNEIEKPILWQAEEEKENGRRRRKRKMCNPLLEGEDTFVFDAEKYQEAVVTPWYRNQDQPQFFLVAEICWNLSPDSSFPSATHQSFRDYYSSKYGVTLTQRDQPLLDVDHTSARLNLLTPRYVNRKGVALPVSSERTRRAKRDRLDQKQILVPELCRVHPFAAPLWFATVALPCVLYRINALLIADEIRRAVAIDVGLGIPKINEKTMPGFQWPALDFGWSLAEVLSADSEKNEKKKEEELKREQKEKELREKEEQERLEKEEQERLEQEEKKTEEVKEKTINDILQEKLDAEGFEIGTWSNDMASSIPEELDEMLEPLPPNLTFCTSASGGTSWSDPIAKPKFTNQYNPARDFSMADSDDSYMSSDLDSDDTDLDYDSDEDTDTSGFCSSKNTNAMGVRIEYKTAHEAEAVDVERCKKVKPAPAPDDADDARDRDIHDVLIRQGTAPKKFIDKFHESVSKHKQEIIDKGDLITHDQPLTNILPETKDSTEKTTKTTINEKNAVTLLFPYGDTELKVQDGKIDVESIERNKRVILNNLKKNLSDEEIKKLNCFSMNDINIDSKDYVNEKVVNVGFDKKEVYEQACKRTEEFEPYYEEGKKGKGFDFDYQPKLEGHPGPSPSVILQALTMSNANDGINLERLETIGDSFLKFAITAYLYCAHPTVHEGKLSHMRSKQVSNLNLYRLGRNKRLGARMIASKFEPHDNWLPPCHKPPPTLHPRINGDGVDIMQHLETPLDSAGCFIPYNLITQHSIPDKSIADCVEALIGAYLLECGPRGALLFMSWLGIRVLPSHRLQLPPDHPYVCREETRNKQAPKKSSPPPTPKRNRSTSSSSDCSSGDESPLQQQEVFPAEDWSWPGRAVGSLQPYRDEQGRWMQPIFGELKAPPSPLLRYIQDPEGELEQMLSGYDELERTLQYRFKDRSLLLQALTHASHHSNRLTDCYQRLEFLGDAILDYLITRHLYEDPRRHSPGALTDLRSALVNNTIFATLAARHGFHKYFRHMSPGLNEVLTKYVKIQEENGHSISEEHYLIQEDEMEQAEDVEVPKALGDLFESVAGAIFLDSGMSLGAVWRSYVSLMGAELEAFSAAAPKSPVRELLEAEPDTATFGKPERLADGRRVRVCVEVFGRGTFKGVGRNYRIAKGTAARCALRHLRVHRAR